MTDYSPSNGDRTYHAKIIDIPVRAEQPRGITPLSISSDIIPSEARFILGVLPTWYGFVYSSSTVLRRVDQDKSVELL